MLIKTLNIEITDELIVSDIDDCLIKSSGYINAIGYTKRQFYGNKAIYNTYKDNVILNANLTDWGYEFINIIQRGLIPIDRLMLITAAKNRKESIMNRFNLNEQQIVQGMSDEFKIQHLMSINKKLIYVDNKRFSSPKSELIKMIVYPPNVLINKRVNHGKKFDRRK